MQLVLVLPEVFAEQHHKVLNGKNIFDTLLLGSFVLLDLKLDIICCLVSMKARGYLLVIPCNRGVKC